MGLRNRRRADLFSDFIASKSSIDVSELHKLGRSTVLGALKLRKGRRSGHSAGSNPVGIEPTSQDLPMSTVLHYSFTYMAK